MHRVPSDRRAVENPRQRVGHYELLGHLGKGGMGLVYRARDLILGREVALKRPSPKRALDARVRRRFLREARAAAGLTHASIVPIFEVFEHQGTPWLAMQLVEGPSLGDLIDRRGALGLTDVLRHAEALAEALHVAHERKILHRDIKPDNVIISSDGRALLADFGLARYYVPPEEESSASTVSSGLTGPGTAVGTPAYMSPEQALGHAVDARSDIFSLGAVLYEMCTGRAAFGAPSSAEVLDGVLHREPPPISRFSYEVPSDLERIVRKCLAKQPDERYQDARDLLADIRALRRRVEHESYSREHPEPPRPRWARLSRRTAAAAAGGLALAALVVVAAHALLEDRNPAAARSLSVAAFQNIDGDPSLDYLSKGLTETIVSRLAGLEGFFVLHAGGEVDTDLVLQGSVQRSVDTLRITYRLMQRSQNRLLGGDVAAGGMNDLFALQDQVAEGVAGILGTTMSLPTRYVPKRPPTPDVTAYDLYLRGRDYLRAYADPANIDTAAALFQKALSRDQSFALAEAGLGEAYWKRYESTRKSEWVARAREACQRATSLDPRLAVAHVCLGAVHNGVGQHEQAAADFLKAIELDATSDDAYRGLGAAHQALANPDEAERAFQQAIALHPSYWAGHTALGSFYFRHARYEEAAKQYEQAIELAPDNAPAHRSLGGIYYAMNRYEDATVALRRSMSIRPTFEAADNLGLIYLRLRRFTEAVGAYQRSIGFESADYMSYGNLGRALHWAPGRRPGARAMFQRAIEMGQERLKVNPWDGDVHIMLAYYHAMLDERDDALTHLEQAIGSGFQDPEFLFWAGVVHNQLGDREEALRWLERSVDLGYSTAELGVIELGSLHGDSRYEALLGK